MFKAVQRRLKRAVTYIEVWRNKRRNHREAQQLAGDHIVRTAYRLSRDLAKHGTCFTGPPQRRERAAAKEAVSSATYAGEIDAELDRIFEGRPRPPQRGGRRIVMLTCPGGNS